MKKTRLYAIIFFCALAIPIMSLIYYFESSEEVAASEVAQVTQEVNENEEVEKTFDENINAPVVPDIDMIYKPIAWSEYRERLIREYAQLHYGMSETRITPQVVVVHWTVSDNWQSAYNWFYNEAMADGTLNVASQFIVDRDGTIYRLSEETALNRHVIGYNWCAIGIENVGGIGGREDLTAAQLESNIKLIRYLHAKYPTINYVFGHYQQVAARASGLYIENVAGYYSIKNDPGPTFMRNLHEALINDGLTFFDEY